MNTEQKDSQFHIGELTLKSAIGEVKNHIFAKVISQSGKVWLVRQGKFAADNIYEIDPQGKGMGGATLSFKLVDGTEFSTKGPWLSNADDLFASTGIDLRQTLSTFVVLAEQTIWTKGEPEPILSGVIYKDTEVIESVYSRGSELAQAYANKLNKRVVFYQQTAGGSVLGSALPENHN